MLTIFILDSLQTKNKNCSNLEKTFYKSILYILGSYVRFPSFYHFVTADEIVAVIAKL